jgi:hypothetical protein
MIQSTIDFRLHFRVHLDRAPGNEGVIGIGLGVSAERPRASTTHERLRVI